MKTFGILAAMDSEAELIINKLEDKESYIYSGYNFTKGTYGPCQVVITVSSIGKVNSAVSTQVMIDKFDLDFIINTGIAGGLDPRLETLSLVIGDKATYHDFSHEIMKDHFPYTTYFYSDEKAVDMAVNLAKEDGIDVHVGTIVTGDQFIEDDVKKTQLRENYKALCCEMEGAAISHVAHINKIPSIIIRCISDLAEDDGMMTYFEFKESASNESASLVLKLIEGLAKY